MVVVVVVVWCGGVVAPRAYTSKASVMSQAGAFIIRVTHDDVA